MDAGGFQGTSPGAPRLVPPPLASECNPSRVRSFSHRGPLAWAQPVACCCWREAWALEPAGRQGPAPTGGRKEGPATNQDQLPEFPQKGGNMPADGNFLTVTSPDTTKLAAWSSEAGWASSHASGTKGRHPCAPGPPGLFLQRPALHDFLYFIPWPRLHHHTHVPTVPPGLRLPHCPRQQCLFPPCTS